MSKSLKIGLLVLVATFGFSGVSHAAVRAIVPSSSLGSITGGDSMVIGVGYSDGTTLVGSHFFTVTYYSTATWPLIMSALNTQIINYASANSIGTLTTSDITYTGITEPASGSTAGLMSASDKTKMDGLATVASTGSYTDLLNTPIAPASYQAIISQTGTAAPSPSITPVNTYSGAPTFTWARTGVGTYTLTASSAAFNTSGKTGVFIQPPTNLNGSFRVVVSSSTVITVTTAVQSLAVLGLLGFTAAPTDAMLDKTMIYVQTYQ